VSFGTKLESLEKTLHNARRRFPLQRRPNDGLNAPGAKTLACDGGGEYGTAKYNEQNGRYGNTSF
jgi:hypothetical protein